MKKITQTILALTALGSVAGVAHAESTETFQVTAKVIGDCSIVANDIDFGDVYISALSEEIQKQSTITATCPTGADLYFFLTTENPGSSGSEAYMVNTEEPSEKLLYHLYADAGMTQGAFSHDGVANANYEFDSLDRMATERIFNIFAKVDPTTTGQGKPSVAEGNYVDTVTLNINFAD